jgi:lysophospholipase L1-like esterase
MIDRRGVLGMVALSGVAATAKAAPPQDAAEVRLRQDWPWLARYAADNRRLIEAGARVDVVFMGDSITEGWRDKRPGFFGAGRVGRGIGGQTTPQMLLRMMPDVIALKPRAVHIMAGTNDIAGNTGPMTPAMTRDNIAAMATLARANGLQVMLASIPPAENFPWRPGLETRAPIAAHNAWIRDYAAGTGATWVDYHPALATRDGAMRPGFASDGVHPTEAGYDAMAATLTPVLRRLRLTT